MDRRIGRAPDEPNAGPPQEAWSQLRSAANFPEAPRRASVGHPVDVATGAVFTAWTDVALRGWMTVRWRRFYSTAFRGDSPLGRGWTTGWFRYLHAEGGAAVLVDDEGTEVRFPAADAEGRRINPAAQMELFIGRDSARVYHWHHQEFFHFEPTGRAGSWRLRAVENLSGDRTSVTYDERSRPTSIADPAGRRLELLYGDAGFIQRIDFVGERSRRTVVRYQHDGAGNLTGAVDACGHAQRYEYDREGRLVQETNRLGGSFRFTYDGRGRCTHSVGDGGYLERHILYDEDARRVDVTDSLGNRSRYHLGRSGSVDRTVDPLGNESQRLVAGALVQELDPLGAIREQERDEWGRIVRFRNWDGGITTFTYDANHQLVERVDPCGSRWRFEYDAAGMPVGAVSPVGDTWRFRCNERGKLVEVWNPLGEVTRYSYDRFGNRREKIDPDGGTTEYEYDEMGCLVWMRNRHGARFYYEYDACNRLVAMRDTSNELLRYEYDAEGNVVRVEEVGREARFEYSLWSWKRRAVRMGGAGQAPLVTTWHADTEGNAVGATDPEGRTCRIARDACQRVVRVTHADGGSEVLERDAAGNVVAVETPAGARIEYVYDAAGRLLEKKLPEGESSSYEYDFAGRLVAAQNASSRLEFEYDHQGNLIREIQDGREFVREFDPLGRRVALSGAGIGTIRYEYDRLGRPTEVTGEDGLHHRFEYGAAMHGPAVHELPNGLREEWHWDPAGCSLRQEVRGRWLSTTRTLASRTYRLAADGRLRKEESAEPKEMSYDPLGRLVERKGGQGRSERFLYDGSDNLVEVNGERRSFDAGNRLVAAGERRLRWDAEGRLEAYVGRDGRERRLCFDADGMLRRVVDEEGEVTTYEYDPLGRRIGKHSPREILRFWWDGNRPLLEVDSRTGREQRFLFAASGHKPLSTCVREHEAEAELYAYHLDPSGAPRELTDRHGTIAWKASYSAYGRARVNVGEERLNPLRLQGQYYDSESGLHYNRFRYYDSDLARYVSPDPIGYNAGLNRYGYPADPVNRSDPLGLDCGDPDMVHLYHGSLDVEELRESGFTTTNRYGDDRGDPYVCVSTDKQAAFDAIDPSTRYDADGGPNEGVFVGKMSREEFDRLHEEGHLSTNDYGGFGHGLSSEETKARTHEGVKALNRAFGLPGGE